MNSIQHLILDSLMFELFQLGKIEDLADCFVCFEYFDCFDVLHYWFEFSAVMLAVMDFLSNHQTVVEIEKKNYYIELEFGFEIDDFDSKKFS